MITLHSHAAPCNGIDDLPPEITDEYQPTEEDWNEYRQFCAEIETRWHEEQIARGPSPEDMAERREYERRYNSNTIRPV